MVIRQIYKIKNLKENTIAWIGDQVDQVDQGDQVDQVDQGDQVDQVDQGDQGDQAE
jgi:hypothetical protein